jgi:hypothetical protein
MGFNLDNDAVLALSAQLSAEGWSGDAVALGQMLSCAHDAANLRFLALAWSWGDPVKKLVFGVIDAARKRGASVSINTGYDLHATVTLSWPAGHRRRSIQMQLKTPGSVYVVRHIDGDWRSARTFKPN